MMCNIVQAENWKTVLSWTHWHPLASDRLEVLSHGPSEVFVPSPETWLRQSWMCCIGPAAGTLLKRALPTNKLQHFYRSFCYLWPLPGDHMHKGVCQYVFFHVVKLQCCAALH